MKIFFPPLFSRLKGSNRKTNGSPVVWMTRTETQQKAFIFMIIEKKSVSFRSISGRAYYFASLTRSCSICFFFLLKFYACLITCLILNPNIWYSGIRLYCIHVKMIYLMSKNQHQSHIMNEIYL